MPNVSVNLSGAGIIVGDATFTGLVTARGGFTGLSPILAPPNYDSAPLTATANQGQAYWVGRAQKDITSLTAGVYLSSAAGVGAGHAEIAVATGVYADDTASIDLTARGYADCHIDTLAASTRMVFKTISGLNISAGSDIWLIWSSNHATTQAGLRAFDGADVLGLVRVRAAYRPSTEIGVARAFTCTPGVGAVCPMMIAQVGV